jgi:hypothetical protein
MSNKYKQNGSGLFSAIGKTKFGKYAGRPFGFSKKIRTSTGDYKSFSRALRGKRFPIISKFRNRSSKNLKNRLNYMNERIAGKTQKIEGYAAKLSVAKIKTDSKIISLQKKMALKPEKFAKYQAKIEKLNGKLKSKTEKLTKKLNKAQTKLTKKLDRYVGKQNKYSRLLEKKIAKSQKRLENGFTKTCKNLRKKPGKSPIACLEAYQTCKGQHGLDLTALTGCVNTQSAAMGNPLDLKPGEVTGTMNKLAKKHFFNRFKQRRHLREIRRLKHGSELQKSINKSKGTIMYGQEFEKIKVDQALPGTNPFHTPGFNKIGDLSKQKTIYQQLAVDPTFKDKSPIELQKLAAQKYIPQETNPFLIPRELPQSTQLIRTTASPSALATESAKLAKEKPVLAATTTLKGAKQDLNQAQTKLNQAKAARESALTGTDPKALKSAIAAEKEAVKDLAKAEKLAAQQEKQVRQLQSKTANSLGKARSNLANKTAYVTSRESKISNLRSKSLDTSKAEMKLVRAREAEQKAIAKVNRRVSNANSLKQALPKTQTQELYSPNYERSTTAVNPSFMKPDNTYGLLPPKLYS